MWTDWIDGFNGLDFLKERVGFFGWGDITRVYIRRLLKKLCFDRKWKGLILEETTFKSFEVFNLFYTLALTPLCVFVPC